MKLHMYVCSMYVYMCGTCNVVHDMYIYVVYYMYMCGTYMWNTYLLVMYPRAYYIVGAGLFHTMTSFSFLLFLSVFKRVAQ